MMSFVARRTSPMTEVRGMPWRPLPHTKLGGQIVAVASRAELTEAMIQDCLTAREHDHLTRPRLVFDTNGHGLSLKETSQEYREAMHAADVVHADGGFLVTLSRWLGSERIAERSATTDLFHDFAASAAAVGLRFYLLGGQEHVNRRCAEEMTRRYPGLQVAGRWHGHYHPDEEESVISDINHSKADVVWVGMGKPREQQFCVRNADQIRAGWMITCGGCFNFVAGQYSRAPIWMQRANLEWLHRAATNPKLIWRYLITNPHALWIALRSRD